MCIRDRSETYTYKGISGGKYIEGEIEALNQEEASFKLKEQKIIITNLVRAVKGKKTEEKKGEKKKYSTSSQTVIVHIVNSCVQPQPLRN